MKEKYKLFLSVIRALDKAGALDQIILIGSWSQFLYRDYFQNSPHIPAIRTLDVDFLVPQPSKAGKDIDISKILEKCGFEINSSYPEGYSKFSNPELEIEFLTPELGKDNGSHCNIKNLHVQAQKMRYLDILQEHVLKVTYEHIEVKVPEPSAFVIQKILGTEYRKNSGKKQKDLDAAKEIGEYLLEDPVQRKKLKTIFDSLPVKWGKRLRKIIQHKSQPLFEYLK